MITAAAPSLATKTYASRARAEFARDVREGLLQRPRQLPSRWLYDDVGSALFEAITYLPEYGLTRAGQRILDHHADAIAARLPDTPVVVELGAGSGRKTRHLLAALAGRTTLAFHPIDISAAALAMCARNLEELAGVTVHPIEDEYLPGLRTAMAARGTRPVVVLFLGSTIGNFDRDEADSFLAAVHAALRPGDLLLLATDLVKPQSILIPAYDDPAGVTAAFDKNMLARVNRELDGDFDLSAFCHEARWNPEARRIEMHLVATRSIRAQVAAIELEVRMAAGESIWTESSHKYELAELPALGARAGFAMTGQWMDPSWPFAQTLYVAR